MEKWAVLIGINHYDRLKPLDYSVNDVSEVRKAFCSFLGFQDDHIIELSDNSVAMPDRPTILHELARIQDEKLVKPDDMLVFYFSGHGMRDKENLKDYLLPCGASPLDLEETAIMVEKVVNRLKKTGCKNIVMFIDACRELVGGAKGGTSIGQDSQSIAAREGVVTFFSCDPKDLSYEIDKLKHSSFTYNVLQAIEDPNCRTIDDVAEFLGNHVPLTNKEYNKPVQLPYTICEPKEKGQLAIFSSVVQLEYVASKLDDLLDRLGERYAEEKLDVHAFNWSVDIVYKVKEGAADERIRKMIKQIEEFCCDNLTGKSLKVALDAIEKGRLKGPEIQQELERLR